jgi:hypothetical protein
MKPGRSYRIYLEDLLGGGDGGPGGVQVRIMVKPMPEEHDGEESDYLIALERFRDRDDPTISSEELRKRLVLQN